jgi:phytoene/squalene synthetase
MNSGRGPRGTQWTAHWYALLTLDCLIDPAPAIVTSHLLPRCHCVVTQLETLRAHPSLGREPFDAMLAGMRADVTDSVNEAASTSGASTTSGTPVSIPASKLRYHSFRPELLEYCYRVAGTVGEMLLPVLGLDGDESVAEAAVALGCAVQLLNIARDVRSDLVDRGRIYLPLDDARRLGMSEAELERAIRLGGPASDAFRRLVRLQSRRASALLRRAEAALPAMSVGQALVVGVIIELHHELVRSLGERGFDCLPPAASSADSGASAIGEDFKRVRVSTSRKVGVTVATAASVLTRGPAGHYSHLRTVRRSASPRAGGATMMAASAGDEGLPSWETLASALPSLSAEQPIVLDTVLSSSSGPPDGLSLFRERHGWVSAANPPSADHTLLLERRFALACAALLTLSPVLLAFGVCSARTRRRCGSRSSSRDSRTPPSSSTIRAAVAPRGTAARRPRSSGQTAARWVSPWTSSNGSTSSSRTHASSTLLRASR